MAVDDDGMDKQLQNPKHKSSLENEHGSDDERGDMRIASSSKTERWRLPTSGEAADPLDEMISGMVKGTLVQTEQELVEEAGLRDESEYGGLSKMSQLGGGDQHSEQQRMVSSSNLCSLLAHEIRCATCANL
jgi:hypothetical protein